MSEMINVNEGKTILRACEGIGLIACAVVFLALSWILYRNA